MQGETARPAPVPPEPLSDAEMAPLWRWERQVTWLNAGAMGALLLAGILIHRYGDLPWLRLPLLGSMLALIGAAALLQFRARCPRCRARLRSKLMTALPDKCGWCGVVLPRTRRPDPRGG